MKQWLVKLVVGTTLAVVLGYAGPAPVQGQKKPRDIIIGEGKKPPPPAPKPPAPKPPARKPGPAPALPRKPPRQSPRKPPARVGPIELEWAVLKVDKSGGETPLIPTAIFHQGDQLRLRLKGNKEGYLQILHQAGPEEPARLIFPDSRLENEGILKPGIGKTYPSDCPDVMQTTKTDIISASSCTFVVKNTGPQEVFTLIYSQDLFAELPQAIVRSAGEGGVPADKLAALLNQNQQQPKLRPGKGNFSFIASNPGNDKLIVVRLVLNKTD